MLRETARLVLLPLLRLEEAADGMSSTTTNPSEPREELMRAVLRAISLPPVSHDPEALPPYFEAALGMEMPASPTFREDRNAVDGTTVDPTSGGLMPVMPLASCAVTASCWERRRWADPTAASRGEPADMRRAVVDSDDDDVRAAWSGPLLLPVVVVAEGPRVEDPILPAAADGTTKASVVLGRVASWRAAAVRNEAALRLRRGAGAAIVVLYLSHFSLSIF